MHAGAVHVRVCTCSRRRGCSWGAVGRSNWRLGDLCRDGGTDGCALRPSGVPKARDDLSGCIDARLGELHSASVPCSAERLAVSNHALCSRQSQGVALKRCLTWN